ncbi:hypothetical protein [uncultured Agrobacterium sp.]|uniref:hypothetical protein n=1 Tax=uncultured Agrobacterium sp. TaxID=157277 RepID=UPI0025EFFCF8|nr:hypothetical protein [uncultured Agrobacterium sp.]
MEILDLRYRDGFVDVEAKWNDRIQTFELGPIGPSPEDKKALLRSPSRELGFRFLQQPWVISEIAKGARTTENEVREAVSNYLERFPV